MFLLRNCWRGPCQLEATISHRSARDGQEDARLTVNAAAEKIIRQELQRLGGPARFLVVPGEGGCRDCDRARPSPAASRKPR